MRTVYSAQLILLNLLAIIILMKIKDYEVTDYVAI
jgi:hypothetical protein